MKGRAMRTPKTKTPDKKTAVDINGRLIPWSFVWRVHALCGKDWDATIDCFWKARKSDGQNGVQRYIMSGLKQKERCDRWMLRPSKERENGKMQRLRDWWLGLYERRRAAGEGSVDVAEMLAALSGKLGLTGAIDWKGGEEGVQGGAGRLPSARTTA